MSTTILHAPTGRLSREVARRSTLNGLPCEQRRCPAALLRCCLLLLLVACAKTGWAITPSEVADLVQKENQGSGSGEVSVNDVRIPNLDGCKSIPQIAIFSYPEPDCRGLLQVD